jgi:hypothetical protein
LNRGGQQITAMRLKHRPTHQNSDQERQKNGSKNDCASSATAYQEVTTARY